MAKYVDGFVFTVKKDKVEEYKKMAEEGNNMWMEHGALEYYECMGDDLDVKEQEGFKPLSFEKLANADSDETVWFSFITFKSKEHRDEVNKKVMEEMDKETEKHKDMEMPFDMSKMAYGGFSVQVSSEE